MIVIALLFAATATYAIIRTVTNLKDGGRYSARRAALLRFCVAALLAGGAAAAHGQSPFDGFDPNVNGLIRVAVVQPDGKILIGGIFTALAPNGGASVTRNNIARLNPDGTLDSAFNPNANGPVYAIAVQADGKILAGGGFTSIGGATRNFIARLDPTTGLADSFDPNPNSFVEAIAVQTDGKILVGGQFNGANSIGGATRNFMARLDPTTALADSFDPNATYLVRSIVVQADGKILAGGDFNGENGIGGATRNFMARLDPATGLADSFDPNANNVVWSIAVQADGKILAGGYFNGANSIGGATRNRIARLNPATGAADSFDPNANNYVNAIAVQADGKILAGGGFTSIAAQPRNFIVRLDAVTGAADSFNPNANNYVNAIAMQADGKILAGGGFTSIGGQTRNRIARLETDGRVDQTLNPNIVGGGVLATAVQPDGKILIGGSFTTVLGVVRNNIARLNTDGTLDMAFDPNANNIVWSIAVQADGKVLAGGHFNGANSIGGATRNYIARLNAGSGAADSFDPNANQTVYSVAVQADGKILAGGAFSGANSIGGQFRNYTARLDPTTGAADSFDPNANQTVFSIAVQADGKILAGGGFSGANSIGGQTRNYIARLDPTTGLADSFNPSATDLVFTIAVQPDGKVLAGGYFNGANSIGGATRNRIARLDPATSFADSFDPNANNLVWSIGVQADGKVLAGGQFSGTNSIGGATRYFIARLDPVTGLADSFNPIWANANVYSIAVQADGKILMGGGFGGYFRRLSNDTAALQNLAVTQSIIAWTRGGSSPQFTRVTFESSTDSVNYSPLGNGTAAGNNWGLTGLSLPTGQNIYVRARGYYRSGYQNGSESIAQSVRNAFLTASPLQLTTAVSRKTHGGAGTFDINLPLSGEPGVECRSSGGNHTLVFTTSNTLVSGNASVTGGTGSVSGSPTFSGNTMTVNLTGVTDVQKVTVTLSNVTDSSSQVLPNTPVSMNVLAGDTSGNKTVNGTDVSQTKLQSGAVVSAANFREDVNVNGSINGTDVSIVKLRSGSGLP